MPTYIGQVPLGLFDRTVRQQHGDVPSLSQSNNNSIISMAKILHQYCEHALTTFQSQAAAAKLVGHNVSAGAIREQLLRDFLEAHLPQLVTVVSGQIFDSDDKLSKQQDAAVVSKATPRLPFASNQDLIYCEGVVATVEVKTNLQKNALDGTCANIASVKGLSPQVLATSSLNVAHKWPVSEILTSIFAYSGLSADKIKDQLQGIDDAYLPDIVLDLSAGILIRNHGKLTPKDQVATSGGYVGGDYIVEPDPVYGLKFFLTALTEITGTLSARAVSWRSYL